MTRDSGDLREYLEALDLCYFHGELEALGVQIRWMPARAANPQKLGHWYVQPALDEAEHVIEISRTLANRWVPDYYVLHIIFHEALHVVHGADHDKVFSNAEKQFAYTYEVAEWEREHANHPWPPAPKGLR